MWKPKYKELQERAFDIAFEYKDLVAGGHTSRKAIDILAESYQLSVKSVYRYLNYAEVSLRGRSERGNSDIV